MKRLIDRVRTANRPSGWVERQAGSLPGCDPAAIPIDLAIAEPQGPEGGVVGFPALRTGRGGADGQVQRRVRASPQDADIDRFAGRGVGRRALQVGRLEDRFTVESYDHITDPYPCPGRRTVFGGVAGGGSWVAGATRVPAGWGGGATLAAAAPAA